MENLFFSFISSFFNQPLVSFVGDIFLSLVVFKGKDKCGHFVDCHQDVKNRHEKLKDYIMWKKKKADKIHEQKGTQGMQYFHL